MVEQLSVIPTTNIDYHELVDIRLEGRLRDSRSLCLSMKNVLFCRTIAGVK